MIRESSVRYAAGLLAACALFLPAVAQDVRQAEPPKAAPRKATPKPAPPQAAPAYPAEDGVMNVHDLSITVAPDGRVTRCETTEVTMYGPWVNARGYFDPTLTWNDRRATLNVDRAWTVRTDGSVIEAKANSLVENTAGELEWAVPYAHVRQMTVSQVGVDVGATTGLTYTVADRQPSALPLWGVREMDDGLRIAAQRFSVTLPADRRLQWSAPGCTLALDEKEEAGLRKYTLARAVAPVNVAEAVHGAGRCRLAWSTAADWAAARAALETRVAPALAADAALAKKALELAPEGLVDAERVARIHQFVAEGVRTVRWPLAVFDWEARPAADVLRSSVGHALDKAVLLGTLLRAAGYDAHVALVAAERGPAPATPAPDLLERVLVRVRHAGGVDWLDPAAPPAAHNPARLAGHAALVLDGAMVAPVVLQDAAGAANLAAVRVELKVEDTGRELRLAGKADLDLGGLYDPAGAFDREGERLMAPAHALAGAFGGAHAGELSIAEKGPRFAAFRTTLDGGTIKAAEAGRPVRLLLPRVPGAVTFEGLGAWRSVRTLPLVLPGPADERVEVVLALPDTLDVLAAPADVKVANAAGSFTRTVTKEGRRLTVKTRLVLALDHVTPQQYPDLRALLVAADAENGRTVLLKR